MNYTQVLYAVTLAERLNFTEAARRLGITQPSLTLQINRLEEELSCRLFTRTTKKVSLTQDGREFLENALPAVEAFRKFEEYAEYKKSFSSKVLNIGINENYYHLGLDGIIAEYTIMHPDVYFNIVQPGEQDSFEKLRSGELNFSFYKKHDSWDLSKEGIAWYQLTREKLYVVGRGDITGDEPIDVRRWKDLGLKVIAINRDNSNIKKVLRDIGIDPETALVDVHINASSVLSTIPYYIAGIGVSLCSEGLAKSITEDGRLSAQPVVPDYYFNPGLVHADRKLTPLEEDFKNFILKKFSII